MEGKFSSMKEKFLDNGSKAFSVVLLTLALGWWPFWYATAIYGAIFVEPTSSTFKTEKSAERWLKNHLDVSYADVTLTSREKIEAGYHYRGTVTGNRDDQKMINDIDVYHTDHGRRWVRVVLAERGALAPLAEETGFWISN